MGRTPACLGPDLPSGVAMLRSYAVGLCFEENGAQKGVGDRRGEKYNSARSSAVVADFVDMQPPVRYVCCRKQIDLE